MKTAQAPKRRSPKIREGDIVRIRSPHGLNRVLIGDIESAEMVHEIPCGQAALVITGLRREPHRLQNQSYKMVRYIFIEGIFGWVYSDELEPLKDST